MAPASGWQPLPFACETRRVSWSGAPSFTEPSEGSDRISARLSWSSTKYGPSVCSGLTIHVGNVPNVAADAVAVLVLAGTVALLSAVASGTLVCASALGAGVAVAATVGLLTTPSVAASVAASVAVLAGGVLPACWGTHPARTAAPAIPNKARISRRLRIRPTCRSSLSIPSLSKQLQTASNTSKEPALNRNLRSLTTAWWKMRQPLSSQTCPSDCYG